ncbi:SDR family oxidoreductase [Aquisphaera insulae]|uniref:SDR family oxidoreductase n=1 Tax=Aquisphaera insulae TaxID=2712864 RepID=UPI0013EA5473|nr:SDR family oxidoreductase [Aquisphaera insulae]
MSANRLDGKVALVTGSSRGIGRAIAVRLARDGAAVVVNYAGNAAAAGAVAEEIQGTGGRAVAVKADVAVVAEVGRLFDEAIGHFGKVDILVNNAGVILYKRLVDVTEAEFDRLFAINVKGTFFCCQQAARRLADGGRIVNFSSSTTALMLPTYSAYVATKGAVEQLSHVLAKEVGARGITVNVVSPGPTDTELFNEGKTEEDRKRLAQMAAFGRLGRPEDIADVVAFLASDEARWISGQNVRANGGLI